MNEGEKWVLFDVEGDDLHLTKVHCLCYEDHEGNKGDLLDYQDIREFFEKYDTYVGHNIRLWDIPQLEGVLGFTFSKKAIDTRVLSWYIDPKRKKNGLGAYGEFYGIKKPHVKDWKGAPLEVYLVRCRTDVEINMRLWKDQLEYLLEIYENQPWKFLKYLDFKIRQVVLQEKSRWKLDVDRVESNLQTLQDELGPRTEQLKSAMPSVPIRTTRTEPKKLYSANGELSVLGQRWKELLDSEGITLGDVETLDVITGYDEPNPNSSEQLKAWLFSLGWVPQTYKEVTNAKGDKHEVPQINKPHGAGLCESVLELAEDVPEVQALANFSVIKHRITVLKGFLENQEDGWLKATVAGLTNTLRFKHSELVNLPKPESRYGEYIRSCLIAPDGDHELLGSDMSGLEDRLKQHYLFPHDPEYVESLKSDDYDPHLDLALLAGKVTAEEVAEYKGGIIKARIKKLRSTFKNGNYCCQYGAGPPKVAKTCNVSLEEGKMIWETYWKRNWAIKVVANEQEIKTVRGQMFLRNPLNGFWYFLRYKKDIFSTLVQGSAAFCFDTLLAFILKDREQLTGQFHDEFILTIRKGCRERSIEWLRGIIKKVNDTLKLNRELDIGIAFGDDYGSIH